MLVISQVSPLTFQIIWGILTYHWKNKTDSFNDGHLVNCCSDSFENEFDGFKKAFRLTENGETVSIVSKRFNN